MQEYHKHQKLIYPSVLELMRVGASQPNQIAVPQLQGKVVRNTANYAKVIKRSLRLYHHENFQFRINSYGIFNNLKCLLFL